MQTSALPLVLVAIYPCAALAVLAVRPVLGALNRLLKESEDPRIAGAWVVTGVGVAALALSGWTLRAVSHSDTQALGLGGYALGVGSLGPLGTLSLGALIAVAGASMLRPAADERAPVFALLLGGGMASLALLADDVRLAVLGLEAASLAAAWTVYDSRSRSESRAAALRQWISWQPGVIVMSLALLAVAHRAEAYVPDTIKAMLYMETHENQAALRWLFVGALALSVLPAIPPSVPDVASRRRPVASIAPLGTSALCAAWVLVRYAYGAFPYAWGWEAARLGWVVIPVCAAALVALLALAAYVRGPSPLISLSVAALGPLPLLAFAQGRPALGAALSLAMAVPLVRAGVLLLGAKETSAVGAAGQSSLKRAHCAAVGALAIVYVGATLWILPHFVDLRFRVAAIVLVTAPSVWAALRFARFALTERVRPSALTVIGAALCAAFALAALVPKPGYGALVQRIEDEMGLDQKVWMPDGARTAPNSRTSQS